MLATPLKQNDLHLLNKKEIIIDENNILENIKKGKIEGLLFEIKKTNSTINLSRYNKKELMYLKKIFIDLFDDTKKLIPNNIIETTLILNSKFIKKEGGDHIPISEEDRQYYLSHNFSIKQYEYYNKLYQIYIENKKIFELLSNINITVILNVLIA
jgi:hypothetical protein